MPILAVKNQAMTRWFTFPAAVVDAVKQIIRIPLQWASIGRWGR